MGMIDDNSTAVVKTSNQSRWIKCRKQPPQNYSKWNTTKGFENFYKNKKNERENLTKREEILLLKLMTRYILIHLKRVFLYLIKH